MDAAPRWGLARVTGDSMAPTLYPGDRVLVEYRREPAAGDVVTARFPDGVLAVKRIEHAAGLGGAAAWFLSSDNPDAAGARRGTVRATDVLGVVRLRLWPHPGRIPSR